MHSSYIFLILANIFFARICSEKMCMFFVGFWTTSAIVNLPDLFGNI